MACSGHAQAPDAAPRSNQLDKLILDIATGEPENVKPVAPRAGQRKGGLKGGKARAKKLSAAKRTAVARIGQDGRWRLIPILGEAS